MSNKLGGITGAMRRLSCATETLSTDAKRIVVAIIVVLSTREMALALLLRHAHSGDRPPCQSPGHHIGYILSFMSSFLGLSGIPFEIVLPRVQ